MKKRNGKSGMTLLEMLVSLLILTLLVTAMGTGMELARKIYEDAVFESESAALAAIVNTALGDVLRYAENVHTPEDRDAVGNPVGDTVGFVFTNTEYGLPDVYFQTGSGADKDGGILILRSLRLGEGSCSIQETPLVNSGAYPNLEITNFSATYVVPGSEGKRGGYFYITYTIRNCRDPAKIRQIETIVRLVNG